MRHAILGAIILSCASASLARAQAFADLKTAAVDYAKSSLTPAMPCENLTKFTAPDIATIQARMVPAAGDAPAHCRVTGVLTPEIAFEVNLPDAWNGRFYMIGNGGHAGEALDDAGRAAQRTAALEQRLRHGADQHRPRRAQGAERVVRAEQPAEGDRLRLSRRASHGRRPRRTSRPTTTAKPVAHSYWNSCSNGGRQGLLEAQRYPDDFDGIVANAPWVDQTGFTIGAMWNQKALTEAPVSPAKLALVAEKVMAKCDAVDGLKDGLIDDPRKCNFDPARDVPACRGGHGRARTA